MAPRPKPTPRKPPGVEPAKSSPARQQLVSNVGKALFFLVLAGISSAVSQLSLSPVYGSIPPAIYHQYGMLYTAVFAFVARQTLTSYLPKNTSEYLPVIAYWIPTTQYFLFKYSSQLGPVYGPVVTEGLTYLPLLFVAAYSAGGLLEIVDLSAVHSWNPTIAEMIPPVSSYAVVSLTSKLAAAELPSLIVSRDFLTRSGLQLMIASGYAALNASFLMALAFPAMLHTMWINPHYESEKTTAFLNSTLQANNFTILERKESLTGYVSVLEDHVNQLRALRCDHSILGGNWLVTPERAAQGVTIPETIYSVFTMLESVRLVELDEDKPDSLKNALFIGLGIGTAPSAFIGHGINTTIVELDPAVHYFATKYFDLPINHTAAIMDAITFVDEVSTYEPGTYDYIIHDVFTGGAEPAALFTVEFFKGIRKLLTDNGVVAINYAGDMALPSTQMILNTIHHVFPACRLYRDSPPPDPATATKADLDFINMIVFCTSTPPSSGTITFRQPVEADFAGSFARRNYLYPKPDHEIKYDFAAGAKDAKLLRKGQTQELEKHQNEGAVSHWKIMRTVLPDVVWENW